MKKYTSQLLSLFVFFFLASLIGFSQPKTINYKQAYARNGNLKDKSKKFTDILN